MKLEIIIIIFIDSKTVKQFYDYMIEEIFIAENHSLASGRVG